MRKKILVFSTIVAFFLCLWLFKYMSVYADDSGYVISEPYEYPVKPNTREWMEMHCTIERHEACDVPKELLARMTTDALVETVITYPFIADIMAFNNLETGLGAVSKSFAGIDELMSRDRQEVCASLRKYLQRISAYGSDSLSGNNIQGQNDESCWPYVYYIIAEILLRYLEGK